MYMNCLKFLSSNIFSNAPASVNISTPVFTMIHIKHVNINHECNLYFRHVYIKSHHTTLVNLCLILYIILHSHLNCKIVVWHLEYLPIIRWFSSNLSPTERQVISVYDRIGAAGLGDCMCMSTRTDACMLALEENAIA